MRLYFRDVSLQGVEFNPMDLDFWRKPIRKRNKAFRLRVNIYQCESLPPADENGSSDPYVEVWTHDEQDVKTDVVEDTNNPIYYQTKQINFEFDTIERAPPIILNIFDSDAGLFGDDDDYLGRAVVNLSEIDQISDNDTIPDPQWWPVKYASYDSWNAETGSAILLSF